MVISKWQSRSKVLLTPCVSNESTRNKRCLPFPCACADASIIAVGPNSLDESCRSNRIGYGLSTKVPTLPIGFRGWPILAGRFVPNAPLPCPMLISKQGSGYAYKSWRLMFSLLTPPPHTVCKYYEWHQALFTYSSRPSLIPLQGRLKHSPSRVCSRFT